MLASLTLNVWAVGVETGIHQLANKLFPKDPTAHYIPVDDEDDTGLELPFVAGCDIKDGQFTVEEEGAFAELLASFEREPSNAPA